MNSLIDTPYLYYLTFHPKICIPSGCRQMAVMHSGLGMEVKTPQRGFASEEL